MPAVSPTVSVVITTHNEGAELARTIRSIVENTRSLAEVLIVDDGSDDGSCDAIANDHVRVIRHDRRVGVAFSRDEASRAARGDVICYLDAHQRVSPACLDRCAGVAVQRRAIVTPDIKDYGLLRWRLHGAEFQLCPKHGYFSAVWRQWFQRRGISRVTALRAPPYLIPRDLYTDVAWSANLQGWGASEASVVMKSFFMGIPILLYSGPLARHRFQKQFPYETTWEGVWRNQAIIARICFDERTWSRYWLRRVFEPHLSDEARRAVESDAVRQEHAEFQARKRRADREFWTELLRSSPPEDVR